MATTQKNQPSRKTAPKKNPAPKGDKGKTGGKRVSNTEFTSPFRREFGGLIFFFLGLFTVFGFFTSEALFIQGFTQFLKGTVGVGFWLYAPVFFFSSFILMCHRGQAVGGRVICALLIPLFFSCICYGFIRSDHRPVLTDFMNLWDMGITLEGCGVVGSIIGGLSTKLFTGIGTILIYFILSIFLVLGALNRSVMDIIDWYAARPRYEPQAPPVKSSISRAQKSKDRVRSGEAPPPRGKKSPKNSPQTSSQTSSQNSSQNSPKEEDYEDDYKGYEEDYQEDYSEDIPQEKKKKKPFDFPFELPKRSPPLPPVPELKFPDKIETREGKSFPPPANVFPQEKKPLENDVFTAWDSLKVKPAGVSVPDPLTPPEPVIERPNGLSLETPQSALGFFNKEKSVPTPDQMFIPEGATPKTPPPEEMPMAPSVSVEKSQEPLVTLPPVDLMESTIALPNLIQARAISPVEIEIADDPSMRTVPPKVREEVTQTVAETVQEIMDKPVETPEPAPAIPPVIQAVPQPVAPVPDPMMAISALETGREAVGFTPPSVSLPLPPSISSTPLPPVTTGTVATGESTASTGTTAPVAEDISSMTTALPTLTRETSPVATPPVATASPPVVTPMMAVPAKEEVREEPREEPRAEVKEEPVVNSGFVMPSYEQSPQAREVAEVDKEVQKTVPNHYIKPPLSLLKQGSVCDNSAQESELHANRQRLEDTLNSFSINARIHQVTQGPSVTRYEVMLEQGVKLSKIVNLSDDIALALGATGVRIAPIPDKISMVGIEVPNKAVTPVEISTVIGSANFLNSDSKVSFAVGKDINGAAIVGNIAKFPHLLVAGTTGSGKSVCTNSLIISLLYKASPEEVRLIMVDPKMVELQIYNGIPHLLIPVVTDPKKAAGALQWAVSEMMKRYRLFSEVGTRDLASYNELAKTREDMETLPQVVVVIDELADLMLVAAKEVEESICRVAQMGRASGMHLIVATQRPSADVITGLMKANIPSRISFAVSSGMESRIILDSQGAEKLVGRGDMLYAPLGEGKPTRVQGCLISDPEVAAVVDFVKRENSIASYSDEIMEEIDQNVAAKEKNNKNSNAQPSLDDGDQDEMLDSAIEVVLDSKQASTSMIQRRLKLGYARAARIVDQMEDLGIVGASEGSKPRQLLISKEQWQEMKYRRGSAAAPIEPKKDAPPWGSEE